MAAGDVAHSYLNVSLNGGGANEADAAVVAVQSSETDPTRVDPINFTSVQSATVLTVALDDVISMVGGVFGGLVPLGTVRYRWMLATRLSSSEQTLQDGLQIDLTDNADPDVPVALRLGIGEIFPQRAADGSLQFWARDPVTSNRVLIASVPPTF